MSQTIRYAVQLRNQKRRRYDQGTEFTDRETAMEQAESAARHPNVEARVVEVKRRVIWSSTREGSDRPTTEPQP